MSENLSSKIKGGKKNTSEINKSGLPDSYDETKVVLLPRDPVWIYVYWDISSHTKNEFLKKYKDVFDPSSISVRVYDVTDVAFNGSNANRYFDVKVNSNALSWYINVGEFNRSWCVDLGYVLKNGDFVTISRSNSMAMPKHGVSNVTDEQWALLQIEFEKLLKISGAGGLGKSSYDLVKLMRERWEEITKLPTSGVLGGASSSLVRKKETVETETVKSKEKTFWLKADTEIIVYGATEPDATLTVQGKNVPLAQDGSFTLRFYLPDGEQNYPIEAISSCGTMSRRITFNVKKETK
ncbi:MAG: DUF4912 domain-containing protein [Endomicrobia bacterium]|nr:DUF4912 domain-containing protein [Endomicrobiia bacterium]MCL2506365.1 DUF4912 domain-containing protein [Endomicrobiia bacterium]